MNFESTKKLSIEELINTSINSKKRDPIFSPQHQKFFTSTAEVKLKPVPLIRLPKYSSQYLLQKSIPSTHRIEVNFKPYLKARKTIKNFFSKPISPERFDLVDIELSNFKNPAYSLSSLFKSNSPIKASRLPKYNREITKNSESNCKISRYSLRPKSSSVLNSRARTCMAVKKLSATANSSIFKDFKRPKTKINF